MSLKKVTTSFIFFLSFFSLQGASDSVRSHCFEEETHNSTSPSSSSSLSLDDILSSITTPYFHTEERKKEITLSKELHHMLSPYFYENTSATLLIPTLTLLLETIKRQNSNTVECVCSQALLVFLESIPSCSAFLKKYYFLIDHITHILLKYGAHPLYQSPRSITPLTLAIRKNAVSILRLFLCKIMDDTVCESEIPFIPSPLDIINILSLLPPCGSQHGVRSVPELVIKKALIASIYHPIDTPILQRLLYWYNQNNRTLSHEDISHLFLTLVRQLYSAQELTFPFHFIKIRSLVEKFYILVKWKTSSPSSLSLSELPTLLYDIFYFNQTFLITLLRGVKNPHTNQSIIPPVNNYLLKKICFKKLLAGSAYNRINAFLTYNYRALTYDDILFFLHECAEYGVPALIPSLLSWKGKENEKLSSGDINSALLTCLKNEVLTREDDQTIHFLLQEREKIKRGYLKSNISDLRFNEHSYSILQLATTKGLPAVLRSFLNNNDSSFSSEDIKYLIYRAIEHKAYNVIGYLINAFSSFEHKNKKDSL